MSPNSPGQTGQPWRSFLDRRTLKTLSPESGHPGPGIQEEGTGSLLQSQETGAPGGKEPGGGLRGGLSTEQLNSGAVKRSHRTQGLGGLALSQVPGPEKLTQRCQLAPLMRRWEVDT